MAPSPGRSIGPYEILGPLGAGGMGQVLKARDTRLNRMVAIKLLNASTGDAGGRSRLLREAQAASSLNHPNIVAVYDILSQDDCDVIVMEYVEGTTLAEQIGRKGIAVRDGLSYLIQIAGALSAAHAAGIVHRDVKPRNVMVTTAGVAKVLDFGLAQVEHRFDPEGETATITTPGTIAGTFLYMSPEQAEGRKVDARSDIFAFGSLLYEMLSGRPAFPGESRLAILGAILHQDPPPLSGLRADIPLELERLTRRCLRKDPARRWQSMEDVRILLEELRDAPAAPGPVNARPRSWARGMKMRVFMEAAALAVAAAVLLVVLRLSSQAPDLSSYRLTPFATEAGDEGSPAWSPDGRTLAYTLAVDGIRQIYTRSVDAPSGTRLTTAAVDCLQPFWSPDGGSIYYLAARRLMAVSAAGGAPRSIADNVFGAAISPDGNTLLFTRGSVGDSRLWIASPAAGEPRLYSEPPFSRPLAQIATPQFSPDGSRVAVTISRHAAVSEPELWILPFPSGPPKQSPVRLPGVQGGLQHPSWMPGHRHLILSVQDHLYSVDSESGDLRQITATTVSEREPAVSPDGRRIAFTSGTDDSDIFQIALDGSSSKPLLATSRNESGAVWSPRNSQYAYVTTASGVPEIWLRDVTDSGARPLMRPDAPSDWYDLEKLSFSPDGLRIAFDRYGERHAIAISNVSGGRPVLLDPQNPDHHGASWSPDGNWIAYRRLNGAKWELVKRPVGGGDPVVLDEASPGGSKTDWSPSGDWICQQVGETLHLVSADGGRRISIKGGGTTFGFSRNGATLYAVRRSSTRNWELASFAVPSGLPGAVVPLDVPASAMISDFSPSPDGKTFTASVARSLHDIWFLEGFNSRRGATGLTK